MGSRWDEWKGERMGRGRDECNCKKQRVWEERQEGEEEEEWGGRVRGNQRGAMARDNPLFVLIICNNEIIIIRDIDELRVTGDILINRQK